MLILLLPPLTASAKYSRQIVDARLVELADRDVLVMRGESQLPEVNGYKRHTDSDAVSFLLKRVGFEDLPEIPAGPTSLIREVTFDSTDVSGTTVTVFLADATLLDPDYFRFSQPTRGVLIFEIFPENGVKQQAGLLSDVDSLLPPVTRTATGVTSPEPTAAPAPEFDPDALGIPLVDLRDADPQRVLGLAAATGLLDLEDSAEVATENWGHLTIKPAGQSITSWAGTTPPDELYLSGTPAQIADFLRRADSDMLEQAPTLEQFWVANRTTKRHTPTMGSSGTSVATRQRVKDDPYAGLYYDFTQPRQRMLSDVRVTLPAMSGLNLYDVINYLSLISGISVMIDPYIFDEPFGGPRPPKVPASPGDSGGGPGFRPAGQFDPQSPRTGGTVIGNFDNVPFDTALELILATHQLVYVVMETGSSGRSGSRYGKPAKTTPYTKPVILVTSRERLEQELPAQNEVDLYQLHYADPVQMTDILDQFGLLPSTIAGWFIYNGGEGSGYSSGGGGGGSTGGGSGGFSGGSPRSRAVPGLQVYRGTTREPVTSAVSEALNGGAAMIRVLLPQAEPGLQVTAFSR